LTHQKVLSSCYCNLIYAGTLKEIGNYGNTPYEFAPEDDAPFPVKGVPSKRKKLMLYCCENCGYVELYAH